MRRCGHELGRDQNIKPAILSSAGCREILRREQVQILGFAFLNLTLEELAQSWARDFGDRQRRTVMPWATAATEDDLFAHELAQAVNRLDGLIEVDAAAVASWPLLIPPFTQNLALRQLLLEELIGLCQCLSVIGNAGIDNAVFRNYSKQPAVVAEIGQLDALDVLLELREFGEEREIFVI